MKKGFEEQAYGMAGWPAGPLGCGTWAIGGPFYSGPGCHYPTGAPLGYGQVDDRESLRALHAAVDLGIKLFDTADAYGAGHSERMLGQAFKGISSELFIATKFGNTFDEETKQLTGANASPGYIRRACHASLKRLQRDWIDLYQLHLGDLPKEQAEEVAGVLESLCDEGLIRAYAWSTDDPERAAIFARRPKGVAVQFDMNIFQPANVMLALCNDHSCAGLIRSPLAMGFLTGKFRPAGQLAKDDIRANPPDWLPYFQLGGGATATWCDLLDSVREILTSKGRSLAQGALAWIWGTSPLALPIPGCRTVAQIEENAGARDFGPLKTDQMTEIEKLLGRS